MHIGNQCSINNKSKQDRGKISIRGTVQKKKKNQTNKQTNKQKTTATHYLSKFIYNKNILYNWK